MKGISPPPPPVGLPEAPELRPPDRPTARPTPRAWPGSAILVAAFALFSVALRLPFMTQPTMPDEAGMLIIAEHWHQGRFLYGDYFVGRGLVVALFYLAGHLLGGLLAVRILACVVAAAMVASAGWAGHQLRGRAGAGWAALVAACYSSTYAFQSEVMNERLLASTLVMMACAATLSAIARPERRRRAVLAGVLATLPVLAVQSHFDGFLFAAVVLTLSVAVRRLALADALRIAAGGLIGLAAVGAALALLIASTWMTAQQLWFQMYGYRVKASFVVGNDTGMPDYRLHQLLWVAGLTGVYVLVLALLLHARRAFRGRADLPVWSAVVAMLGFAVMGMVAGGDYWTDYLLQPIPALALGAALIAPTPDRPGRLMRLGVAVAVVAAFVAVYMGKEDPRLGTPSNEAAVGRWVGANTRPGDTGLVLWGKANVLQNAGLSSPYPYLWSLLTRTLDPQLTELLTTMRSPQAPTWVVVWTEADAWGLDSRGHLAAVLRHKYVQVGRACGAEVFLLRGDDRPVLPDRLCGAV